MLLRSCHTRGRRLRPPRLLFRQRWYALRAPSKIAAAVAEQSPYGHDDSHVQGPGKPKYPKYRMNTAERREKGLKVRMTSAQRRENGLQVRSRPPSLLLGFVASSLSPAGSPLNLLAGTPRRSTGCVRREMRLRIGQVET